MSRFVRPENIPQNLLKTSSIEYDVWKTRHVVLNATDTDGNPVTYEVGPGTDFEGGVGLVTYRNSVPFGDGLESFEDAQFDIAFLVEEHNDTPVGDWITTASVGFDKTAAINLSERVDPWYIDEDGNIKRVREIKDAVKTASTNFSSIITLADTYPVEGNEIVAISKEGYKTYWGTVVTSSYDYNFVNKEEIYPGEPKLFFGDITIATKDGEIELSTLDFDFYDKVSFKLATGMDIENVSINNNEQYATYENTNIGDILYNEITEENFRVIQMNGMEVVLQLSGYTDAELSTAPHRGIVRLPVDEFEEIGYTHTGKNIYANKKQGSTYTDFKDRLAEGTEHEFEHTDDRETASQIALDHLGEDPEYYNKLDKCMPEKEGMKKKAMYDDVEVLFTSRGDGTVTLALPGFELFTIDGNTVNDWIKSKWGANYGIDVNTLNDDFMGLVDVESVYNFLWDSGHGEEIESNAIGLSDLGEITSAKDLKDYFFDMADEGEEPDFEYDSGMSSEEESELATDIMERDKDKDYFDKYTSYYEPVNVGDLVIVTYDRNTEKNLWGESFGEIVGMANSYYRIMMQEPDGIAKKGEEVLLKRNEFLTPDEYLLHFNTESNIDFEDHMNASQVYSSLKTADEPEFETEVAYEGSTDTDEEVVETVEPKPEESWGIEKASLVSFSDWSWDEVIRRVGKDQMDADIQELSEKHGSLNTPTAEEAEAMVSLIFSRDIDAINFKDDLVNKWGAESILIQVEDVSLVPLVAGSIELGTNKTIGKIRGEITLSNGFPYLVVESEEEQPDEEEVDIITGVFKDYDLLAESLAKKLNLRIATVKDFMIRTGDAPIVIYSYLDNMLPDKASKLIVDNTFTKDIVAYDDTIIYEEPEINLPLNTKNMNFTREDFFNEKR